MYTHPESSNVAGWKSPQKGRFVAGDIIYNYKWVIFPLTPLIPGW
jgi:hypothetical protein